MTLQLFFAAQSETGRRPANEDYYTIDEQNGLYIVADGTASRGGGNIASNIACTSVREMLAAQGPALDGLDESALSKTLQDVVVKANEQILAKQATDANLARMATTFSMVLMRGNTLHIVWVGDSRIYLYRGGELTRLTRDHNLENYLKDNPHVKQKVERPGKTLLSAMGLKRSQLRVDYLSQSLERDDLVLLCSDGLTDALPDWILREILAGAYLSSVDDASAAMVRAALSHGGMDNITVLLLHACEQRQVAGDGHTVIFETDALPDALAPSHKFIGWLVFAEGEREGEIISLDQRITIGAATGCTVIIKGDDFISSRHAEVRLTEYGFEAVDLSSTNGLYLNNQRISIEPLVDGDTLRVGKTPMVFKSFKF